MEAQHPEWILNLLKAHSGEPLLVQVASEAIRRRDAELLEKVKERKEWYTNAPNEEEAIFEDGAQQALDDIIKLIKGE